MKTSELKMMKKLINQVCKDVLRSVSRYDKISHYARSNRSGGMTMAKRERLLHKMTVADAVSQAFSDLTDLGQELRDWADNIEEKFGSTDKYQRLDDSASTLEGLIEPSVPESLEKVEVTIPEQPHGRRGLSRPKRRDYAVEVLDIVVQELQTVLDHEDKESDALTDEEREKIDEADTLINEIEDLKSEAENVEFPGMYG